MNDGWEDTVVALAHPDLAEPTTEYAHEKPEWRDYYDRRHAAIEACPIEIVYGGNLEAGGFDYSLAIKASHTWTDWDYNPKTLQDTPLFNTDETTLHEWRLYLRTWAHKLGLPWDKIERANPEAFQWLIVTSWG